MIQRLFKNYITSIIFALIILIISLMPMPEGSTHGLFSFPNADKLVHGSIYTIFTILLLREFLRRNPATLINIAVLLGGILSYSILIEIFQQLFTSSRTGDVLDVMANLLGVIIGTSTIMLVRRIRS
jgi:VanZ family protein